MHYEPMRGRWYGPYQLSLSLSPWPSPSSSPPPEGDGIFLFNHRRLLQLQNPFTRPLPKATATPPLSLPLAETPHVSGLKAYAAHILHKPPGGGISFVPSAVATATTSSGAGSKDELAISELGLPQRLVESLESREITQLFPIQIRFQSFF